MGEVWVATPAQLATYLRPDELHTAFNFGFLLARWDADAMRVAIDDSIGELAKVGAPPTWVLSNHDVTRHVTRFGGGDLGRRRARTAALLMLALPGGAYVYPSGGVHLYWHQNLIFDIEGGYHFPFAHIDELRGPRAQATLRFSMW